jgi:hypothetical protein
MALEAKDKGIDHNGNELPPDVYASTRQDGSIAGYRVRWREEDEDGIMRQPSKSFSARKAGSLDQALAAAAAFLDGAREAVRVDGAVSRPDASANLTMEDRPECRTCRSARSTRRGSRRLPRHRSVPRRKKARTGGAAPAQCPRAPSRHGENRR